MKQPLLGVRDLSRAGHLERFHSVRTARRQTLAEHLYMTGILTNMLSMKILKEDISDIERLRLLEYALWHDTPELIMGTDIASPLKQRIAQMCGANNPICIIEKEIAPWLTELKASLPPEHAIIVKLADIMDAVIFIRQEGMGKHASIVTEGLQYRFQQKIKEAKTLNPKYDWELAQSVLEELLDGEGGQIAFETYDHVSGSKE